MNKRIRITIELARKRLSKLDVLALKKLRRQFLVKQKGSFTILDPKIDREVNKILKKYNTSFDGMCQEMYDYDEKEFIKFIENNLRENQEPIVEFKFV